MLQPAGEHDLHPADRRLHFRHATRPFRTRSARLRLWHRRELFASPGERRRESMRSRLKGHWRRMAQVLGLILLSVVIVLATAPLWAPRVGLGLPLPPPPGTVVPIPGGH